jgi:hypothetical protein
VVHKLLSRDLFREGCFARDKSLCVLCGAKAVDAHHIMDRKLFKDGGYYLDNAASVCDKCHRACERCEVTVETVRTAAGIRSIVLPPGLDPEVRYNKWGKTMFGLNERIKYPKTMHLPWSPGLMNDDRLIESLDGFKRKRVVVTAKMDGENCTMYRDAIHARSLDAAFTHPSRAWVRALHGQIKHDIPEGWRLCGENMYAQHSIKYTGLPSYFLLFSIWNEKNECLAWPETQEWAKLLGLVTVPHFLADMGDGLGHSVEWCDALVTWLKTMPFPPKYSTELEGYVVRTEHGFHYDDFHRYIAKYVRKNHIQTDEHWMSKQVIPNGVV